MEAEELKQERKVHAENMRLKKKVYELQREIEILKSFLGV